MDEAFRVLQEKLLTRRDELVKTITRTERGVKQTTIPLDLADKAANSYTESSCGQTSGMDRSMLNLIDER
jgi:hypothetical protein